MYSSLPIKGIRCSTYRGHLLVLERYTAAEVLGRCEVAGESGYCVIIPVSNQNGIES